MRVPVILLVRGNREKEKEGETLMETKVDAYGVEVASNWTINVLIVIDTEYVKSLDRKQYPLSTDPNNPTRLPAGTGQFMLCTGARPLEGGKTSVTGQGTGSLSFKANVKDWVSFYGQSIYGNADDAVIIYQIHQVATNPVFGRFTANTVEIPKAAFPDSSDKALLPVPAVQMSANFVNLTAQVSRAAENKTTNTETYYVHFGLYTLNSDNNKQELLGYYDCDPSIRVV